MNNIYLILTITNAKKKMLISNLNNIFWRFMVYNYTYIYIYIILIIHIFIVVYNLILRYLFISAWYSDCLVIALAL